MPSMTAKVPMKGGGRWEGGGGRRLSLKGFPRLLVPASPYTVFVIPSYEQ